MARVNKREEVLEAIARIIERVGLTTVTLDAVAVATGMTRFLIRIIPFASIEFKLEFISGARS